MTALSEVRAALIRGLFCRRGEIFCYGEEDYMGETVRKRPVLSCAVLFAVCCLARLIEYYPDG